MANKDEPPAPSSSGSGRTTLIVALVGVVIIASIVVVAMYFNRPTPEAVASYEIGRRDRQISRLTQEIEALKEELARVRRDYAQMVAERRCEAIDGLDDCLAAGLTRPERFHESDAALLRQREEDKARKLAEAKPAPATAAAHPPAEGGGMKALMNILKSIPGVKTD